jgi:FkbM family methyltransferase
MQKIKTFVRKTITTILIGDNGIAKLWWRVSRIFHKLTRYMNVYAYEECASHNLRFPDLPVLFTEQFGQEGEDVIISAFIRALATRHKLSLQDETYLEVGGNHPIATSSTYLLAKTFGMRGVIVEANPKLVPDLERIRRGDTIIHGAVQDKDVETVALSISNANELSSVDRSFVLQWDNGKVGERGLLTVPAYRINRIMEEHFSAKAPLYMSIDIEGMDLAVLKDMDFAKFRPAVIQAEPSDHHIYENSRHMHEFMESKRYLLVARTNFNLVFVDRARLS